MNIGIIDVDHHHFPNLALMKISGYHKAQGDDVEWYSPFGNYDRVYMAKVFTFSDDYAYHINNADEVIRGGTGFGAPYVNLPDVIDRHAPDYALYDVDRNLAYGFLTRGCIRKCPWCVVPIKEGALRPYMDIEEIAIEGRKKIVLMDNNIIAAGDYGLSQIEKIIKLGLTVDFNQAMDARIVDDEIAKMLAQVRWINKVIRFGCDTKGQIEHCEKAIELLWKYGYNGFIDLYTMLHGTLEECYHRTSYWRHPRFKKKVIINPQPMLDLTSKVQHIPQWQRDMARWGGRKQIYQAIDFKVYEPRKGFVCSQYFKS